MKFFVGYLYQAAIAAYLILVIAIAWSACRSRNQGRWAGALLALLLLTIPAWVMGTYWLYERLR